jgi:acyl-CoA synthetase (AMP-forming)/AMP-acid ligase II
MSNSLQPTAPVQAGSIGIGQVFERSVKLFRERVAVADENGRSFTYRQLDGAANSVARYLESNGIEVGDRVAVLSDPCPEYVILSVACAKLGVALVGLNTRFTGADVIFCVEDCEAKMVFADPSHRSLLKDESNPASVPLVILDLSDSGGSQFSMSRVLEMFSSAFMPWRGAGADIYSVLYTSGTTGRPKGAMVSQAAAAIRALRITSWFGLDSNDAFLGWCPLFHTGGDEPLCSTLATGGCYLTFRHADAEELVTSIDNGAGTWSWLLPGMFAEFMDAAATRSSSLGAFRFGGGYGNLLPSRLIDDLVDRGPAFFDLYGQTEASLLIASNRIDEPGEIEWKKTPTPLMEIKILTESGEEGGIDEPGECVVRGPSVMSGYLNQPQATEEVFAGGWLHTGDVLQWTDDGYLKFTDRKKYLIKTGGENVYPAEIEAVLSSHPGIAEACVIGIPDERWGETVKAFVVRRSSASVDSAELDELCRASLAGFKRPRVYEFLTDDEVPRSATGKVVRPELVARERGGGEHGKEIVTLR